MARAPKRHFYVIIGVNCLDPLSFASGLDPLGTANPSSLRREGFSTQSVKRSAIFQPMGGKGVAAEALPPGLAFGVRSGRTGMTFSANSDPGIPDSGELWKNL